MCRGVERAVWCLFRMLVLTKSHGHTFNSTERRLKGTQHRRGSASSFDDKTWRGCDTEAMSLYYSD